MAKYMFNCSKAAQIIRGIKVPSDIANSVEVIEALRMAIKALEMQIQIGQTVEDLDDDEIIETLNDVYMFSEVNL